MLVLFSFLFYSFPVQMRGMLVGGWRELGRKQGLEGIAAVVVVVVE